MTDTIQPNSDLASLDQIALAMERDVLRGIANERYRKNVGSPLPESEPFVRHLDDAECERLVAIINELRRRSGGQPRDGKKSSKKSAASDADILSM